MRINCLQHTPNEGPGYLANWAEQRGHEFYTYHPRFFDQALPQAGETDMLVVLGGPMSPNDDVAWIKAERQLIWQLLQQHKPIFGACFGAQQIVKALGKTVHPAPYKEVGWAPVYRQDQSLPGLPASLEALHWHQDMFELPDQARLLFSSDLLTNQGFLLGSNVLGLQFHFEPKPYNLREMVVNDGAYALEHNALQQTPAMILNHGVPEANQAVLYQLLDYISA
ncbi:MAG: type 1 glutamine amidotransferase [Oscillospiraceae bacterium]|nr:type 1 glutamine amidotransferase [Oscillospiraceae bacterium]MDD4367811.1 type 1 glutamine amidotransferase [Oscillospiraceae bacterium]